MLTYLLLNALPKEPPGPLLEQLSGGVTDLLLLGRLSFFLHTSCPLMMSGLEATA